MDCKVPKSLPPGLTVVELLVAVAIVGILAAIAVPNLLGQMPKYRLNGATRMVMGDLMAARMKAVSQNNEYRVIFLDNHQYTILDDDNNNGTADSGEATQTRDIQTDYRNVTLSSNKNPIFNPRGTASNWGTITLTTSSGSSTLIKEITVNITGRVRIK